MIQCLVECPAGTIRGSSDGNVARFLGVPYAEAPVGRLRFQNAQQKQPSAGVIDATRWGATPQRGRPFESTVVPEPSVEGVEVLNLNVLAPSRALSHDSLLPVIVWIHGGGYVSGSAASPWYDGERIASNSVVFISISYRLGIEGFGLVDGNGNRALSDWLAALEWVNRNIRSFGGDPERVTVAGQSAGGGAVLTLLASPVAQPLFARAVALSPVDISSSEAEAASTANGVDALLQAQSTSLHASTALEAQSASVVRFTNSMSKSRLAFSPMHGDVLLTHPIGEGLAHNGLEKPLLVGTTADEFEAPGVPQSSVPSQSDILFRAACLRSVRARSNAGSRKSWMYEFGWKSPVLGTAGHCFDVPFFLGTTQSAGSILGSHTPEPLAEAMLSDLLRFVGGHDPAWSPSTGGIGDEVRVYSGARQASPFDDESGVFDRVVGLLEQAGELGSPSAPRLHEGGR